jgi:hypothetical protein
VQLQDDFGAYVQLGETVGVPCGSGADVGCLGARGAFLGLLVGSSAAA